MKLFRMQKRWRRLVTQETSKDSLIDGNLSGIAAAFCTGRASRETAANILVEYATSTISTKKNILTGSKKTFS